MPLPLLSSLLPGTRVSLFANPETRSSGASLTTADGRSLALVGARLRGEARGGIARLVLEQRFENRFDETLHVTYRMPLPADGAVSGYAFEIGDRTITGRVDKKAAARERFERAIVEGKTAALLEQNRDDIFTQQIGNLPAREALIARITIDQRLAWLPEGEWELRFPTVIGPRYVGKRDPEQDARDTHVSVAPDGIAAGIQIAIQIGDTLSAGRSPGSPTHTLLHRADGSVELKDEAALDRDIVVRWPVAGRAVGLSIETARRADGDAFGLLTIVPPAREARPAAIARDLIVLLDTSGSMSGPPLDKAKQAVAMLIESLGEQDRLELIEFSNEPVRYKAQAMPATAREKQDAIRWVKSRRAGGGTEMASAVFEAMHALRAGAQRQVVLITDGYVGGEQQIVRLLHENLPRSCRLHVLGVGSAVNRSLATAMARAGRGAEVLVGLDEDVERAIKRLVDRTRMPVLTNVSILGTALVHHAPEHVPDVFEGAPIVAALALDPAGGELVVRGELAAASGEAASPRMRAASEATAWEQRIRIPARAAGEGNQAICALYAREHVADLEMQWTIGDTQLIDREIETTGVRFQIATRMTSWVAVDEARRVKPALRHENVPQALPHGTNAAAFGLRSPAGELDEEGSLERSLMSSIFEGSGSYDAGESDDQDLSSLMDADVGHAGAPPEQVAFEREEVTGSRRSDARPRAPARSSSPAGRIPEPAPGTRAAPPRPQLEAPSEHVPSPTDREMKPRHEAGPMRTVASLDAGDKLAAPRMPNPLRPWMLFVLALLIGFLVWWLVR